MHFDIYHYAKEAKKACEAVNEENERLRAENEALKANQSTIRAQAVRECAAALEIDTLRNGSDAMYMRDYADKIERGEA